MIRYFKINWILFKNSYIRDSKIPGVIFANVAMKLFDVVITIIFFKVIFSNTTELSGWSFYQVLFLYMFTKVVVTIQNIWVTSGVKKFAREMIRRGDYDFYLSKPVNPMILVSISQPRIYYLIALILEIILCFYAVMIGGMEIHFVNLIWFLFLAVFAIVLYYFLSLLTVVPAFWFIRLWSLQDLMGRLNQVMRYPAGVFPYLIRVILLTAFPIIAISYVPSYILFNPPKIEYIIYIPFITIFFGLLVSFIWRKGNKHYASASS